MKNSIDRITILNAIFENFVCAFQWGNDSLETRIKEFHKAECLIELLEVDDCGSIGGYDRDNPVKNFTRFTLFDRFLTVVNKYGSLNKIKDYGGKNVQSLTEVVKKDICR
jgi:hypothetical protein